VAASRFVEQLFTVAGTVVGIRSAQRAQSVFAAGAPEHQTMEIRWRPSGRRGKKAASQQENRKGQSHG
jgi:hypothetical protein